MDVPWLGVVVIGVALILLVVSLLMRRSRVDRRYLYVDRNSMESTPSLAGKRNTQLSDEARRETHSGRSEWRND